MRQLKIKIPADFAWRVMRKFNSIEYTEEKISRYLGFFNKYNMEKHNIIIRLVCYDEDVYSVATSIGLPCSYVQNVYYEFFWTLSRRLGSGILLVDESNEDMATAQVSSDSTPVAHTIQEDDEDEQSGRIETLRDLLLQGIVSDIDYKSIQASSIESLDDLVQMFNDDRFGLFQREIRGLSSVAIVNLTRLCTDLTKSRGLHK